MALHHAVRHHALGAKPLRALYEDMIDSEETPAGVLDSCDKWRGRRVRRVAASTLHERLRVAGAPNREAAGEPGLATLSGLAGGLPDGRRLTSGRGYFLLRHVRCLSRSSSVQAV